MPGQVIYKETGDKTLKRDFKFLSADDVETIRSLTKSRFLD